MNKLSAATALALVMALTAGCAQDAGLAKSESAAAATPAKVDNFRLVDEIGRSHELYALKDAKAVVVVMQTVGSDDMRKIAPELEKVRAEYASKGVEFMMMNSSPDATRDAVAADVKALGVNMPVLMDELQLVGGQMGASKSSEVFVIEPNTWKIAYRGPLTAGKGKSAKPLAVNAIDALVTGQSVAVASAPVKGAATIAFPDRTPTAKAAFQNISYTKTIAPIIEEKCIVCHEQGGIAPFAMDSYEKVKAFAPMIRETIRTDRMPPWDVDPHVGKFKDDKSLSSEQIKTMVRWVEAGAPRGEGDDPLAAKKHVAPEWPLGKPDMIVEIPSYTVPAQGVVDYQYPVVDNPLTQPKWLRASTTLVDSRQVVHHVLSGFINNESSGSSMANWGASVGGYTVGMESVSNPKGYGTYMPAGGKYGFQMHYTPYGKETVSKQRVGLYFYKDNEKPEFVMREMPLVDQFIKLPPNDGAHKETAYFLFPKDAMLYTTVVHAHYRGTYSNLKIVYPDKTEKMILNVPHYDFNWQRMYEYDQPIPIPAGSKLVATYIYDNSKRNPANPDPSKEVVWGDQSFEEMFYTSLRYRWMDETVEHQTNYDDLLQSTRLLGMMDDNLDDKVEEAELRGPFATMLAGGKFQMVDANKDGGIDQKEFEAAMKFMQSMRRPKPAADAAPAAAAKPEKTEN